MIRRAVVAVLAAVDWVLSAVMDRVDPFDDPDASWRDVGPSDVVCSRCGTACDPVGSTRLTKTWRCPKDDCSDELGVKIRRPVTTALSVAVIAGVGVSLVATAQTALVVAFVAPGAFLLASDMIVRRVVDVQEGSA